MIKGGRVGVRDREEEREGNVKGGEMMGEDKRKPETFKKKFQHKKCPVLLSTRVLSTSHQLLQLQEGQMWSKSSSAKQPSPGHGHHTLPQQRANAAACRLPLQPAILIRELSRIFAVLFPFILNIRVYSFSDELFILLIGGQLSHRLVPSWSASTSQESRCGW